MLRRPPRSTLFPYTSSSDLQVVRPGTPVGRLLATPQVLLSDKRRVLLAGLEGKAVRSVALFVDLLRSEEHTSELQSRRDLVCRLLLEKKKTVRTETLNHQAS